MRILVVEDEALLGRHLTRGLKEEGWTVDLVTTVREARNAMVGAPFDLVLLDVGLPDGTGFDLLRRWRAEGVDCPVMMLTARDALVDKVSGLDLGADDYVTKPFAFEELLARVRTLLRRRSAPPVDLLRYQELVLDRVGRSARVGPTTLELTARELGLLEFLLERSGRVVDRTTIAEHVWDESYTADSNVIDVLVSRLRRKIRSAGGGEVIHTVKGLGYVLGPASSAE
jgi:DNA-binding response OmpR family regulator